MKKISFLMIFAGLFFLANICTAQENNEKPKLLDGVNATISGLSNGAISAQQLTENEIIINKQGYKITSFTMRLTINGETYPLVNKESNKLSGRQAFLVSKKVPGDQVFIEEIICKDANGKEYSLPSMAFTIK